MDENDMRPKFGLALLPHLMLLFLDIIHLILHSNARQKNVRCVRWNFLFNKTCIAKGVATLQSRSLQGRQSRWARQHSFVYIALISCRNEESDSKHVVVEWKASWYHFSAMLTKNSVIFFRLMNEFLSSNCFQHTTMMIVYQSNV